MKRDEITKLSDEELKERYEKAVESVNYVWEGCTDGSYEYEWLINVSPYEEELKRRGLL